MYFEFLRLPLSVGLYLTPGWLWARRMKCPLPLVAAFLLSAAILFLWTLLLNAAGVPINFLSLAAGFILTALPQYKAVPSWSAIRQKLALAGRSVKTWPHWYWFIPAGLAFASLLVRATIDPLSGIDNAGRWDYLAHLFLRHSSLAGYPPQTDTDFESYSWCDGIPPLIPLLNAWLYASTGSLAAQITASRVVGEALLLGVVVFHYSQLLWGPAGARASSAALGATALVGWAVAIGQETGMTAITLLSMLYYIDTYAESRARGTLVAAGIAAGVGALCREYALAYPALGCVILAVRRQFRSEAGAFVMPALLISAPWYLRNWWLTNNPLFPQSLGGLFPTNGVHAATMALVAQQWHPGLDSTTVSFFLTLGIWTAGIPICGAMIGVWLLRRRAWVPSAGIILIGVLWLWSIAQTAAGWTYSMRVLAPAIGLMAVLSGWIGTRSQWLRGSILAFAMIVATDAARRSWLLPENPRSSPWSISFDSWRDSRAMYAHASSRPLFRVLVGTAQGGGIVVDHGANHLTVTQEGGRAIPFFSPLLKDSFDDRMTYAEVLARLRSNRVRFITLSEGNPLSTPLIHGHPFWDEIRRNGHPIKAQYLTIYDLEHIPAESPMRTANAP